MLKVWKKSWLLTKCEKYLILGFFHFFVVWMVWAIFQPHKSKIMVSGQGWKVYQTPVRPYYLWYVCNLYNLYVQAKFHPDTLDYLNYLLFFPKWSASQNLTDKLHRTQARPCATSPWLASPRHNGVKFFMMFNSNLKLPKLKDKNFIQNKSHLTCEKMKIDSWKGNLRPKFPIFDLLTSFGLNDLKNDWAKKTLFYNFVFENLVEKLDDSYFGLKNVTSFKSSAPGD